MSQFIRFLQKCQPYLSISFVRTVSQLPPVTNFVQGAGLVGFQAQPNQQNISGIKLDSKIAKERLVYTDCVVFIFKGPDPKNGQTVFLGLDVPADSVRS
jgi:hypothetical protein